MRVLDTAPGAPSPTTPPTTRRRTASSTAARAPSDLEPKLPETRLDSIIAEETYGASVRDTALRVVVSLADRRLWVLQGADTLRAAPAAVGMNARLDYGGEEWTFETPRGERTVEGKRANPYWVPPDWHYVEVAREYGFRIRRLLRDQPVSLSDGRTLEIRGDLAGLVASDSLFAPLPTDEEIVFDSTIFIPPVDTKNRRVPGELGQYQLDLGDGYLLHGTPQTASIGTATTHGCIRLHDADIAWLYENVGVGTRVYIY